jgi:flavin-binding protein dodecin
MGRSGAAWSDDGRHRAAASLGQRPAALASYNQEIVMSESVYKVIEIVGTSPESWEKAASAAIDRAGKSLKDLRIAEVEKLDMQIEDGKVTGYRARLKVSFKFRD